MKSRLLIGFALVVSLPPLAAVSAEVIVRDPVALRSVLAGAIAGSKIKIAAGEYPGGHHVVGIDDLTIEALDPANPPLFKGGKTGWIFDRCNGLTLRHLRVAGQSINGLNISDGGRLLEPVSGVTLEDIEISDIGPSGNHDGIKCSGVDRLVIRRCAISGWGGQGIDFVGCHHAVISGCRFTGKEGFSASAGVQLKGGTSDVLVEDCVFIDAGERPINLGGSTGLEYFRPPGAKYEATRLTVRGCKIEGSLCAAAFVGVDGAEFNGNTILFPRRWIFRILQETREPGFVPCRAVRISNNKVIFRRGDIRTDVNMGDGIAAETFDFESNHWFAEDAPARSRPALPVAEKSGRYGIDPR